MSDSPENPQDTNPTSQGGWHTPRAASPWQASDTQTSTSASWRTVKALPDDIDEQPDERGQWHLPKQGDTSFSSDDEIAVSDEPKSSAATSSVSAVRPEDLINEILSTTRGASVPKPEDVVISRRKDEDETVAADALEEGETLLVDEEVITSDADPLPELEDLDDESLTMSDYVALANLAQGEQDLSGIDVDKLTPAERVAFNIASQTADEMESRQRVSEPLIGEDATVTMEDTSAQGDNQAVDYARQQLAQLQQGGDRAFGAGQEEPQREYTREEIQLAQQFRETKRQVAILRQMQAQGQITQSELQARLQQNQILDPQGNWWNIGIETDEWYRYNNQTQEWEVATPPVPLDIGQVRTETGLGEAAPDVLPGSLPYLPGDRTQDIEEYSDEYDGTQYSEAQQDYSQQYGVEETPIPVPGEPPVDPNMTVVGEAWDKDSLSYAEPTLQGLNYVDQTTVPSESFQEQQTVPSQSYDDAYYDQGIPQAQPQATGFEDYEGQAAPTYEEIAGQQRSRTLLYIGLGLFGLFIITLLSIGGFFLFAMGQYNAIVTDWRDEIAALGTQNFDFQTATILAADGTVIAEITGEEGARTIVSIEDGEVSPFFVHAIVSSEDPRFYENPGFDVFSIARAFFQNLMAGEVESGASTITQQIVRERVLGNSEVSFDRKLTEVLLALEVANTYSKNEILDIYINEFFYGAQSYGVEAAADFYFNTSAAELDIAQAATLAGILPSPSSSNPVVAPAVAFANMRVVLDRMFAVNCLNFQHGDWAVAGQPFCVNENTLVNTDDGNQVPLTELNPDGSYGGYLSLLIAQIEGRAYEPRQSDILYPHFVFYVLGQLDVAYGGGAYIERGFTVQTTLQPSIQDTAQAVVEQQADRLGINGVQTGAAVVTDVQSGAILAMVGSPDFYDVENEGQNNNVLSLQQPGSAIKPVLYAAALQGTADGNYFTPASILWDVPSPYNINGTIYEPVNFDGQYHGPVPVRIALAQSLNIPAVKTYATFGTEVFVNTANALGIDFDPLPDDNTTPTFGLPTAVGATEVSLYDLTHAYATIANDGIRNEWFVVESITERGPNGNEVDVPLEGNLVHDATAQVISPQNAYLLQNILSDNNARTVTYNGVPSSFPVSSPIAGQSLGLPNQNYVAVKTGTNNTAGGSPSRIWTVGFTNNYAVGIWFGTLDQGTPMTGRITGLTGASSAWNAIMQEALNGVNPGEFARPSGVVVNEVCQLTGTLSDGNCVNRISEIYNQAQPPPPPSEGFVTTVNINTWTGLVANQWCAENVEPQTFVSIADPFALSWLNNTARGRQIASQLGLPNNPVAPPEAACQQGQPLPTVVINFPQENTTLTGNVAITGQINAAELARWELQISEVGTDNFRSIMPQSRTDQVPTAGTVLHEWDSREVPNGAYILRLAAFSNVSGGFIFREVRVNVQNTPPTPTPQPATEIPIPVIISPIPFDLPTATPSSP